MATAKKEMEHVTVKIELTKSLIGCLENQISTAHSMGLRKIGDTTEQPDNLQTQGKIKTIEHLVEVYKEA